MKLTKTQRQAIQNAVDYGDAFIEKRADGTVGYMCRRVSYKTMCERLHDAGLLCNGRITDAGRAALTS
jgi:hypothetical protein